MNDVAFLDAVAQAELVRSKQISPSELLQGAIERIERLNPQLNAVITPMYDIATSAIAAGLPDGPFKGVPFLMKDLVATYGGVRQTNGSRFTADWVPDHDSELVRRHKAAGLVTIGKTNTPEFGLVPTTEPVVNGPTRNPWNTNRSTGGSSGGSAAAVASGMAPMGHGGDGGGSIRIPASACGLFGLKPTRARITFGPDMSEDLDGLTNEHAITRTVRDSAALLDATCGSMPGDPYVAPEPKRPFLQEVGADPGRLRIGFTRQTNSGTVLHPDVIAAVDDAAKLCEELGHDVEEAMPDVSAEVLIPSFTAVWAAGCTATIDGLSQVTGKPVRQEDFEILTWALYEMGKVIPASVYLLAVQKLQGLGRVMARFHETYDLWLTPTLGTPPPELGHFDSTNADPMGGFQRAAEFVPFTPVQNATGQPAMSVPLYWNAEGLPIGVHFAARYGDEATLFRLASQLEEARPWANRRPPVSA